MTEDKELTKEELLKKIVTLREEIRLLKKLLEGYYDKEYETKDLVYRSDNWVGDNF